MPLSRKGEDNTASKGLTTQTIILAALVKKGYEVLLPWGDHRRYDLAYIESGIWFKGAQLVRVQCKTGWLYGDGDGLSFQR